MILTQSRQDFSRKILEAEQELSGNSADIQAARTVLRIGPGRIDKLNDGYLYKAVNRVLAYRILDVCQWVKSERASLKTATVPTLLGPYSDLLQKLVCIKPSPVDRNKLTFTICRKHRKCKTGPACSCGQKPPYKAFYHLTATCPHAILHKTPHSDCSPQLSASRNRTRARNGSLI